MNHTKATIWSVDPFELLSVPSMQTRNDILNTVAKLAIITTFYFINIGYKYGVTISLSILIMSAILGEYEQRIVKESMQNVNCNNKDVVVTGAYKDNDGNIIFPGSIIPKDKPTTCIKPTINNPMGSIPRDEPEKYMCDPRQTMSHSDALLHSDLTYDTTNLWKKQNFKRQFLTGPTLHVPRDTIQPGLWFFSSFPSCKNDGEHCLRNQSLIHY